MTTAPRLLRNTMANMSAHVVTAAVAFITLPFMMAHFGKGYYGVFALVNSLVALVALFDLGVTTVLIKQVAQLDPSKAARKIDDTVKLGSRWLAIFGVSNAIILGIFAFLPFLTAHLSPDETFLFRAMLAFYALAQLVIWPAKIGNIILAGKQRYDIIALTNAAVAIVNAAAIVSVLLLGRGPLVLTACFVAVSTTASVALAVYALRMQRASITAADALPADSVVESWSDSPSWFAQASRQLLRIAFPIFVIQVAVFTVQQQTDRVILGILIGATAIALYEVAAKLGTLLFQVIGLAISATPSFVAHKETVTSREGMNDFFLTGSRYLSLLLIPTFAVVLVFAPTIIQVWMGSEFAVSKVAAQFLIASALPFPLLILIDSILVARDQYKVWLPYALLVAAINLVCTVVLVLQWGFVGVAIGTFIASLSDVGCKLWVLRTQIGCSVRRWTRRVLLPSIAGAGIAAILALLAVNALAISNVAQLLAAFACTVAGGYAIIFFSILAKDEQSSCLKLARSSIRPWQNKRNS
ncbi:MAG: polysaccharide biosynthesis C-terminal domain-containing protein [Coriobacteriia bacterium]|nr:polysaccharide biosynthesis C-terminal domain-containing protein [Coriobacteriia bacterium]